MVETTLNIFDVAVIGIILLSALLSFFRGFVREILSLGAWVGASLITLYTFMDVAQWLGPQVGNPTIASGLAAMGVFIFSLMAISILNALFMRLFKTGKDVGMLDNLLGLGFGVLRACLLISLAYFIFSFFMPEESYPEWMQTAKTRPYVASGAQFVAQLAPSYLENLNTPDLPGEDATDGALAGPQQPDAAGDEPGYNWMRVKELERMIENRAEEPQQ